MRYQVVVSKKAQKDLNKIDNRYRSRILVALSVLADNPFVGKKLKGERDGEWSYRIWPYRIIYRVKNKELIVLIVRIGHRQGVYK